MPGPKNYKFSRLTKPPIPGKAGFDKLELSLIGVMGIEPNEWGLHAIRTTRKFKFTDPEVEAGQIKHIANPNTEMAMYISCVGRHSVVYFRDEFWAVMAVRQKRTRVRLGSGHWTSGDFMWHIMQLLKPGATYSREGESGTWEGLPEESIKYLTEFISQSWDLHTS